MKSILWWIRLQDKGSLILDTGGLHKENPIFGPKRLAVWIESWGPDEKDVPQVCILAAF